VEASAIPASVGLTRTRIAIGASLLRIRSDEQLVSLFREGNDEAFRVIHDRYRARMFAYARQMLGASGQDPEDAVQEIFMRAYHGLRASRRRLALRAWLYRIAHNRCIDDLRRPQPVIMIPPDTASGGAQDPAVKIEQRDALRRLICDVQRLPGPQRSALLMRELSGMSYAEVSGALGVSVPAVKSLLVRARVGLGQASEARNTACADIRADLILAHDRGVRTSGLARRHLRDCQGCREFRSEVRGVSRQLAALAPTLGPIGVLANLLGWGGGGAATGSGAVAGGGAAASGSAMTASGTAAAGGAATSAGLLAGGASHVVTILAAAVVTAGGAVEIERTVSKVAGHHSHRAPLVTTAATHSPSGSSLAASPGGSSARVSAAPVAASYASAPGNSEATPGRAAGAGAATGTAPGARFVPITEVLDPDMYNPQNVPAAPVGTPPSGSSGSSGTGATTSPTSGSGTGTGSAATGSSTNTPGTTATGSSTPANSSTSTGSTSGSSPGTSSSSTSSSGGASGSAPSSSAPSTTSTAPSSNAASTPSTGSGSVGRSTSSAASGTVVGLAKHRRVPRRYLVDRLGTR
jgi:RNA polymerase sigma factor (sigma-70 family)